MLRKRVKYPTGWTLLDENIKDVERVCLDPETQRKLCCIVGEYVFLEYPWIYVPRDDVLKLSHEIGSCLGAYREKISAYNGTSFLFGYNSIELSSDEFVICLTEEARDAIVQRNKNISKAILNGIRQQIEKIPKFWKSLGSEDDLESSAENTRELYEIEINLPTTLLGLDRQLSDRDSEGCRDSYIDLIPINETFDNINKLLVSRETQTHLQLRESYVQTYPKNPRNACTQYVYEDTLNGKLPDLKDFENVEKSCDETEQSIDNKEELEEKKEKGSETEISREKEPIEIFLEEHSQRMIDEIKYNAVVNLYVDDIKSLSKDDNKTIKSIEIPIRGEYQFFIDLKAIKGNTISDISWHPKGLGIICMACVSPALVGASHWFLFVATTSFIATLLWCFVYLLSIREALKIPINWILTELLNTSVEAVLYMIAFIAQLSLWSSVSNAPYIASNIAGGVFGILNTLAYAAGAYFLYIEWKSNNSQ